MNPVLYRHIYSPLRELHRDINHVLHQVWGDQDHACFNTSNTLVPVVDIEETAHHFIIYAELPGVREEDISLEIHQGVLTLKGEKRLSVDTQDHVKPQNRDDKSNQSPNYHIRERRYGYFSRSIQLPRLVKDQDICAQFEGGVLTVTIPKVIEEQNKAQKIAISKSSTPPQTLTENGTTITSNQDQ